MNLKAPALPGDYFEQGASIFANRTGSTSIVGGLGFLDCARGQSESDAVATALEDVTPVTTALMAVGVLGVWQEAVADNDRGRFCIGTGKLVDVKVVNTTGAITPGMPLKAVNAGTSAVKATAGTDRAHFIALESQNSATASTIKALLFSFGMIGYSQDISAADSLSVGGVIVPQELEVSAHVGGAALMVDQSFFVATQAYQVTKVKYVHSTAESTASTLRVQVVKDTSTDAPGAGTDLLTNNTNAGFDCKATANTVQSGTLTATTASLQLAAGDRLSLDFTVGATELVGVTVTVTLKRI